MKFFPWLSRKESRTAQAIMMSKVGNAVGLPKNYTGFSKDGYARNVVVFKTINAIAGCVADIPLCLYEKPKSKKAQKKEIEQSPLLDLINHPNPTESKSEFWRRMVTFYLLTGNTFTERVRGLNVPVSEMYSLRADRVRVVAGQKHIAGYVYKIGTSEVTFPVDPVTLQSDLLHTKTFNPLDDFYGLSPIEPAALGVDSHNEAGQWNFSLLQNQANPSGVFTVEVNGSNPAGALDDNQRARIEKELRERFQGSKNVGRTMFFEGGVKWNPMSLSPQDMMWMEAKNVNTREICWAYGYPSILLGLPGDSTYNNVSEAKLWLYDETVLPLAKLFLDQFNRWLVPLFGDNLVLEMDLDGIEALAEKRSKTWDKVNTSTFLTINERREAVGFAKLPEGGDIIPVGAGLVPLTSLSEEPEELENPDTSDYMEDEMDEIDEEFDDHDASKDPEDDEESDDKAVESIEKKNTKIKFENFSRAWAKNKAGTKVTKVAGVSKKKVTDTVRDSVVKWQKSGEPIDSLAKTLRSDLSTRYDEFSKSRAYTIARTESASAANNGSFQMMKTIGIPNTVKEWLATSDDRSRDFHDSMNGKTAGLNEYFMVPNPEGAPDEMMGPHDENAPVVQLVNCRCVLVYEIKNDEEKSINVRNKNKHKAVVLRSLKGHELRFQKQVAKFFRLEKREIIARVTKETQLMRMVQVADDVIESNKSRLESIFRSNYEVILREFGSSILKQLE